MSNSKKQRKRRRFSGQEKIAIIRQHLIEGVSVSDICDEYSLNVNTFYTWQKTLFDHGAEVFDNRRRSKVDPRDQKIEALEAKLSDRDEGLAELMMDHVRLKKKLGQS